MGRGGESLVCRARHARAAVHFSVVSSHRRATVAGMGRRRALGGAGKAAGLAILLLAATAPPAAAAETQPASTAAPPPWPAGPDIDPANPPPWPVNWRSLAVVDNVPSRFDRAPLSEVAAAAKAGDAEARAVLERGIRKKDTRVIAWA